MENRKLTLLHTERPKLHTILAFLSAVGLMIAAFFRKYSIWLKGKGYTFRKENPCIEVLICFFHKERIITQFSSNTFSTIKEKGVSNFWIHNRAWKVGKLQGQNQGKSRNLKWKLSGNPAL